MLRRALLLSLAGLTLLGAATPRTAPTDPASIQAGAKIFGQYCQTCHGKTGSGDGPSAGALKPKPRNFHDAKAFKSKSDEDLFKVVGKGGASMGLSPLMVAWSPTLKEQQIWQVIAYVKTFSKAPASK